YRGHPPTATGACLSAAVGPGAGRGFREGLGGARLTRVVRRPGSTRDIERGQSQMRVMTVRGPVDPEELGVTLTHDHIIIDLRHSLYAFDALLNDVDLAIDELKAFKDAGGGAVVDVTGEDLGRNVRAQRRISEETGLHVVAATAYYIEP